MARILIIDDAPEVRRFAAIVLRWNGHDVLEAADGEEGLRVFLEECPDLVVCDIFMPGREGLETISAMVASRGDVPVLAISGGGVYGDLDVLRIARILGAREVLAKPFSALDLNAAVERCVAKPIPQGVHHARRRVPVLQGILPFQKNTRRDGEVSRLQEEDQGPPRADLPSRGGTNVPTIMQPACFPG